MLTLKGCHCMRLSPAVDPKDNWQQDGCVKWILETAICFRIMQVQKCLCVRACMSRGVKRRVRKTARERFVMLTLMLVVMPVFIFTY